MNRQERASEPSMEEILASIRKIIAEEPAVRPDRHSDSAIVAPLPSNPLFKPAFAVPASGSEARERSRDTQAERSKPAADHSPAAITLPSPASASLSLSPSFGQPASLSPASQPAATAPAPVAPMLAAPNGASPGRAPHAHVAEAAPLPPFGRLAEALRAPASSSVPAGAPLEPDLADLLTNPLFGVTTNGAGPPTPSASPAPPLSSSKIEIPSPLVRASDEAALRTPPDLADESWAVWRNSPAKSAPSAFAILSGQADPLPTSTVPFTGAAPPPPPVAHTAPARPSFYPPASSPAQNIPAPPAAPSAPPKSSASNGGDSIGRELGLAAMETPAAARAIAGSNGTALHPANGSHLEAAAAQAQAPVAQVADRATKPGPVVIAAMPMPEASPSRAGSDGRPSLGSSVSVPSASSALPPSTLETRLTALARGTSQGDTSPKAEASVPLPPRSIAFGSSFDGPAAAVPAAATPETTLQHTEAETSAAGATALGALAAGLAVASVEPKAGAHVEPKAAVHVEPKAAVHVEPKAAHQIEPKANADVEPKAAARAVPKAATPVEPAAATSETPRSAAAAAALAGASEPVSAGSGSILAAFAAAQAMKPPATAPQPSTGSGSDTPAGQAAPVRTLEDAVADLLRPMLQQWLTDNMPRIIEKALRVETVRATADAARPPGG
ncbi:MAG: DUF2497 domain-containing protein [Hyphomicrobium sp.]